MFINNVIVIDKTNLLFANLVLTSLLITKIDKQVIWNPYVVKANGANKDIKITDIDK